jgi:hypothetical protein
LKVRKFREIFEGNLLSPERVPARAGKYSGCLLIERLICHPTDCTRSAPVAAKHPGRRFRKGKPKGEPERMPLGVAVKSEDERQEAEDARSGRKTRSATYGRHTKKTPSVLKVVEV